MRSSFVQLNYTCIAVIGHARRFLLSMLLTPYPTTDFRTRGSGGRDEVSVWLVGLRLCCFRKGRRLSSTDGSAAFAEAQLQLCWQPANVRIIFRENWKVRMIPSGKEEKNFIKCNLNVGPERL